MRTEHIQKRLSETVALCNEKKLKIAVAESCTGGLLSAWLTEIPGVSAVFERGFVTYSNEAKTEMLGVNAALIAKHGAVSAEVARAMAEGALSHSTADIGIGITGIAGPDGGSREKPVGLVYIAVAREKRIETEKHVFPGDRQTIRENAAARALELISLFCAS